MTITLAVAWTVMLSLTTLECKARIKNVKIKIPHHRRSHTWKETCLYLKLYLLALVQIRQDVDGFRAEVHWVLSHKNPECYYSHTIWEGILVHCEDSRHKDCPNFRSKCVELRKLTFITILQYSTTVVTVDIFTLQKRGHPRLLRNPSS